MLRTLQAAVGLILVVGILAPAQAREWKDKSGTYKIEADLIGFDDETVILQRENEELGACKIEELCEEDQAYLKSKEAKQIHTGRIDQMQTWTTASGLKVRGKIVDYADKVITIQRRRGKIYIDDQVYTNLPGIYQQMLPKIVSHFESIKVADAAAFERWVKALLGFSKTYRLQGVILELENGDEYGVPFFLLSEKDLQILKPGWESWLQAHEDPSTGQNPDDESFRLQSLAAAYQQDQKINQQIAIMNLNMQAIQSGIASAWEVSLYPAAGYNYRPRWVVVMARNSLDATQMALRQNPGYRDGPVRRVSN